MQRPAGQSIVYGQLSSLMLKLENALTVSFGLIHDA